MSEAPFGPWSPETARLVVAEIASTPGPVLRCLQAIQETFGYIPADAVSLIAETCNVSRADVHGVLTYYSDLRTSPPPPVPVRLCAAEACQAVGGRELADKWHAECESDQALAEASGVDQPVYCLGNCALGPAALVAGELIGRATVEVLATRVRSGAGVSS